MGKIKIIKTDWELCGCIFFDAGDIYFKYNAVDRLSLSVYKSDGTFLFRPFYEKGIFFGFASMEEADFSIFDTEAETQEDFYDRYGAVCCFDPRIVMAISLISWLAEQGARDKIPRLVQDVLTPVPTIQEAKIFLQKNDRLVKQPVTDEGLCSPKELSYIPEEVRNLLR